MKVTLDPKYTARLAGTLLGISLVTALLLGLVDYVTRPVIAAHKEETKKAAMSAVLTADEYKEVTGVEAPQVTSLYEAVSGGSTVGYVVESTANGFGGAMTVMVGVNADGTVAGVEVTDQKETAGVGSKVVGSAEVLARFKGLSAHITVNSGDNRFDAVSGATVSSKAVTSAVNAALNAVAAVQG